MKKIVLSIISLALGLSLFTTPAMATNATTIMGNTVPTAILSDCSAAEEQYGSGEGIKCILRIVVNVLSVGVAILGVIGITVASIQYLTAGSNEEQTRKAKRRVYEIVIGLAIYAIIYALLSWLLPGFSNSVAPPSEESASSIAGVIVAIGA